MSAFEQSSDFDHFVGFYVSEKGMEQPGLAGNGELVPQLHEEGVGAAFIAKDSLDESGDMPTVQAYAAGVREASLRLTEQAEEMPLASGGLGIVAVRARIATPDTFEATVPVINGPSLRQIGGSHWRQHQYFGDMMPDALHVPAGQGHDEDRLQAIEGGLVVVKSDVGMANLYTRIGEKQDVSAMIEEIRQARAQRNQADKGIIIEAHEPGQPITGMQAAHESQQHLIDGLEVDANTELRTYAFADRTGGETNLRPYSLYRIHPGDKEREDFIPVTDDSLPDGHLTQVRAIVDRIMDETGQNGVFAAVDMFGSQASRVREVNLRDPGIGGMLRDADDEVTHDIRRQQMRRMADQLVTLARSNDA